MDTVTHIFTVYIKVPRKEDIEEQYEDISRAREAMEKAAKRAVNGAEVEIDYHDSVGD
jgi:hypothetical protein